MRVFRLELLTPSPMFKVISVGPYGSSESFDFPTKEAAQQFCDNGFDSYSYHIEEQKEPVGTKSKFVKAW